MAIKRCFVQVPQGALPLDPGGDVIPAPLALYNNAPSIADEAAMLGALL